MKSNHASISVLCIRTRTNVGNVVGTFVASVGATEGLNVEKLDGEKVGISVVGASVARQHAGDGICDNGPGALEGHPTGISTRLSRAPLSGSASRTVSVSRTAGWGDQASTASVTHAASSVRTAIASLHQKVMGKAGR